MYMIIKEWQILWVLDESAFCNDQLWHKCQSYFYISLFYIHSPSLPFSLHKLLKCGSLSVTMFWSLMSATFGRFSTFLKLPKVAFKEIRRKTETIRQVSFSTYSTRFPHNSETVFTITRLLQHSRQMIKMGSTDRSGRFSCRSAPCRRCLLGNP